MLNQTDLDHMLTHTDASVWESLRGRSLFLTGGTGFFGCWLLESLKAANAAQGLNVHVTVLTRSADAFRTKAPDLANAPGVTLHEGDVRNFAFPDGHFDYVLHAATDASAQQNLEEPLRMLDTVVDGTRRTLDFARQAGATRFLLTSSGAVYGRQPPELSHVGEDYVGAPDPLAPNAAYGEGKRAAEMLCAIYARAYHLPCIIARCYAFLGPYLALDGTFAAGNFVRDALKGGPISIGGDGTPYRSYLYGADLVIWLWTLLIRGESGRAYNVGSAEAVSIAELARATAWVAGLDPDTSVKIARVPEPGRLAERYVPAIDRAASELNLKPVITLEAGLRRMLAWNQKS